jgi:uncharacterized protein (DUF342 family)
MDSKSGDRHVSNRDIEVFISPDGMEAAVSISPRLGKDVEDDGKTAIVGRITQAIADAGVTWGINNETINSLVESRKWGEQVAVARGVPPVDAEDGKIEYYFETEDKPRPKVLAGGRVDYHEIGLIHFVEKNALLAQKTPPKPGKPGMSVLGEPVPERQGEDVSIKAGPNTLFEGEGELKLRAEIAGSVSIRSGAVHLEPSLLMKNGVNFSSGNVDFPGDIVIQGDINSGFAVKSTGKIEIWGAVEDAQIEADGDVLIKGGFTGSGQGKICTKGDVSVKFIVNQTIEAAGSVQIGDTCVHADINAGQRIDLSKGNGAVVGGHLRAKEEIVAKVLGNIQHATTTVEIILDEDEYEEQINSNEREQAEVAQNIKDLKNIIFRLRTQKDSSDKIDPKLLERIRGYQTTLHELNSKLEELISAANKLRAGRVCEGHVVVLKKVYPGTQLIIGGIDAFPQEEYNSATFGKVGDEVVDLACQAVAAD